MAQNTSHAVMQQRRESLDSLDDFPTPPWATRALVNHVIKPLMPARNLGMETVWEPASNRGYMVRALEESFLWVERSDVENYGVPHQIIDFLGEDLPDFIERRGIDWIITNPPFNKAEAFAERCRQIRPSTGYALLVRTAFLEGVGRYDRIFSKNPPNVVAQFSERVPMVKGRYDPKASTATSYCWLMWVTHWRPGETILTWIPPCRRELERETDV